MFRVYFAFYKHFRLSMSELVCQLSQRTVHVVVLVPTPSSSLHLSFSLPHHTALCTFPSQGSQISLL